MLPCVSLDSWEFWDAQVSGFDSELHLYLSRLLTADVCGQHFGGFLNEEVVRCQDVISSQMSGHMHTCYKISSSA